MEISDEALGKDCINVYRGVATRRLSFYKCLFQTIPGVGAKASWVDLDSLGVAHGSPKCHRNHCL